MAAHTVTWTPLLQLAPRSPLPRPHPWCHRQAPVDTINTITFAWNAETPSIGSVALVIINLKTEAKGLMPAVVGAERYPGGPDFSFKYD